MGCEARRVTDASSLEPFDEAEFCESLTIHTLYLERRAGKE
jgi:hypothetical protein